MFVPGIFGIVKSMDTRSAKDRGDLVAAQSNSITARNILIATVVCGIIGISIVIVCNVLITDGSGDN